MSLPLAAWMFPVLMFLIFMGFPVGFALMGTAFVFGIMIYPPDALAYLLTTKVADAAGSQVLAAVPLFIFMGTMMERSGIAERLFEVIHMWTRRLPGGLAVGTVLMCVVFAAASGVIGATESVVGLLAIPVMLKYAYDKGLISGTICAGGSLGTIIPPSIVVVILGPVADVDVGSLFVGMLFPGLILAGLYMLYILILCTIKPSYGPRLAPDEDELSLIRKIVISIRALVPPIFLIAAVLGTIIAGWATPTEAAAMGAAGSIILTLVYRTFTFAVLSQAFVKTIVITAMILMILLGGTMFAGVFVSSGGMTMIQDALHGIGLTAWPTLLLILFLAFLAGFVLELVSIILIFIPIVMPLIKQFGFNEIWFCILFLIVIQTSYLTPPMAPAIFYLRGISPPEITLRNMYRGVIPFIGLQFIALGLVMAFPALAIWLPDQILGFN